MPKKVAIGAFLFVGCAVAFWAVHVAVQISRPFPPEEVALLGGQGAPSDGWFLGQLYNGSHSWTVREVTIRIIHKEAAYGKPKPDIFDQLTPTPQQGKSLPSAEAPPAQNADFDTFIADDEKGYRIGGLWLLPLATGDLRVEVLSPTGLEFDGWRIVSAKGFKNYW
jgi:hypothetical protein